MNSSTSFYAHGKLLLTGEYLVLDGANALAIPTKFGQSLQIEPIEKQSIWTAKNVDNEIWQSIPLFDKHQTKDDFSNRIHEILMYIRQQEPQLFTKNYHFTTKLEFPNNWGLGSSSTLISLLSQWSGVDPYELLDKTFGGSGYDIASALAEKAIVYTKVDETNRSVVEVELSSNWTDFAYFVHLGKKQNSRSAIQYYQQLESKDDLIPKVNQLTATIVNSTDYNQVCDAFNAHEELLSNCLQTPRIQEQFKDFNGICKSLGAWGGDFIMVLSQEEKKNIQSYFANKGLTTFFTYEEMKWK